MPRPGMRVAGNDSPVYHCAFVFCCGVPVPVPRARQMTEFCNALHLSGSVSATGQKCPPLYTCPGGSEGADFIIVFVLFSVGAGAFLVVGIRCSCSHIPYLLYCLVSFPEC
jgi:hypothetical protein